MSRRLPRLLAIFSAGLILCTFMPSNAARGVDEEFVTGSGTSYAQIVRVGPTAGQLSLAPVFGLSLANYVNTVGRGQATVADWAGIGVAERALPDNTPIVKVRSTDKGAEDGVTTDLGGAQMYARATKAPSGEGRFRIAGYDVPGVVSMRGSESNALSGVKGRMRESTAITKIGEIDIAGLVTLKGLRWESVQRTGSKKTVSGKFSMEGVSIGGVPLALPAGTSDLKTVIDPINSALAQVGLSISLPVIDKRGGQSEVSPLSVDIKNSPAGRQFLAPILAQLQEPKQPVIDLFADLAEQLKAANDSVPDLKVGILLADLTVGILSGSSQLHLEFGGVSAFTEGEVFKSPFGGIDFNPPKNTVAPPQTVFTPGTPGTKGAPGATPVDEGVLTAAPAETTRTIPGDKGGVAIAVGLIGLGVAIGLAIGDWYRMRISRRAAAAA